MATLCHLPLPVCSGRSVTFPMNHKAASGLSSAEQRVILISDPEQPLEFCPLQPNQLHAVLPGSEQMQRGFLGVSEGAVQLLFARESHHQ